MKKKLEGALGAMETSSHSHSGSVSADFASVTKGMLQTVPTPILNFGPFRPSLSFDRQC